MSANAQTLTRSLLQALHCTALHCTAPSPSSHNLAPFSAFFYSPNIPRAVVLILHHNTASASALFSFLFIATHTHAHTYTHTPRAPLFFSLSRLYVVCSCTPGLQSHPIAEPLVRLRPTRAFSSSLHCPSVHVVCFFFVTRFVQQRNAWLRLIG
jgi:hypothetical protein